MENISVNDILVRNKGKIKYIGIKNSKISQIKSIISNTKPNPEKLFIAEGIWAHRKIISTGVKVRSFVFCPECIYSPESINILETLLKLCDDVYAVSEKVFEKISERDKIDGLLSICKLPTYNISSLPLNKDAIIIVADGIEIPGNLGTIMRTCDGANIDAVLLCNKRIRLTHPKFIKGSMGAAFVVPFAQFDNVGECKDWLEKNDFDIYLADTRAEKYYYEYDYKGRTALIVGSERYGVSKEWYTPRTKLLSIPMLGVCDSLNVGVASSIILYDMSVKHKNTFHYAARQQ